MGEKACPAYCLSSFFFLYYNDAEIDDILLGMRWCCPLLGPLWVCHDISDDDLDEDDQWASKW